MHLVRALYTSRQASQMTLATVRDLNRVAQSKNAHGGVTGLLCYAPPFFAQCLEGSRTAVSRTLERIYRDGRHTDITLVGFREVDERAFADWAMRLIHLDDLPSDRVRTACLKHGGAAPFRPDFLNEAQLFGFLRELAGAVAADAEYTPVRAGG